MKELYKEPSNQKNLNQKIFLKFKNVNKIRAENKNVFYILSRLHHWKYLQR